MLCAHARIQVHTHCSDMHGCFQNKRHFFFLHFGLNHFKLQSLFNLRDGLLILPLHCLSTTHQKKEEHQKTCMRTWNTWKQFVVKLLVFADSRNKLPLCQFKSCVQKKCACKCAICFIGCLSVCLCRTSTEDATYWVCHLVVNSRHDWDKNAEWFPWTAN